MRLLMRLLTATADPVKAADATADPADKFGLPAMPMLPPQRPAASAANTFTGFREVFFRAPFFGLSILRPSFILFQTPAFGPADVKAKLRLRPNRHKKKGCGLSGLAQKGLPRGEKRGFHPLLPSFGGGRPPKLASLLIETRTQAL